MGGQDGNRAPDRCNAFTLGWISTPNLRDNVRDPIDCILAIATGFSPELFGEEVIHVLLKCCRYSKQHVDAELRLCGLRGQS